MKAEGKVEIRIGYCRLLINKSKAYITHANLEGAEVLEYKYIGNECIHFKTTFVNELGVKYPPEEIVDLTGLTTPEVNQYWVHQEAREKLMAEKYFPQTVQEWRADVYEVAQ